MNSLESSSDGQVYKYRPILDKSGIRVISLSLSNDGEPKCDIIHTKLGASPTYEALSYTWGDTKDSLPLRVDGNSHIMVSKNLFSALRHLVAENEARILWIDQLCINQNDLLEKGFQVEQMGQIYEKASMTIIWLGEDNGDSAKLFDMVGRLQSILGNPQLPQSPATGFEHNAEYILELKRQGVWDEIHFITRRLLERPWFQRVWVFQEAVMSANVMFLLGLYYFPWDQVVRVAFLSLSPNLVKFSPQTYKSLMLFARMNSFRYIYSDKKKLPLAVLLMEGSGAKCLDPRDLVYSLLGMIGENIRDLRVDYKVPIETLSIKVTRLLINRHRNLAILATIEDERLVENLPSWAPDWSFGTLSHCFDIAPEARASYYNASKGFAHRTQMSEELTHLTVNGKVVDEVQEVVDHCFDNLHSEDLQNKFPVKKVFESLQLFLERRSYPKAPHRTMLAAVLRSLIGGHVLSMDDIGFLHRLPPNTDIGELLLDYSDDLLTLPDSDNSRYRTWKGSTEGENPMLQIILTRLMISTAICEKRRIIFNRQYPIGLAPRKTLPGDLICILHGATAPCILRPDGDGFRWIGSCYVNAIMQGEAVYWEENEADTFILF